MSKTKSILLAFVIAFSAIGCAKNVVRTDENRQWREKNKHQAYFFWGSVPTKEYLTTDFCEEKGGIARIEQKLRFRHGVAYFFTLGLYSPRMVQFACVGDKAEDQEEAAEEQSEEEASVQVPYRLSLNTQQGEQ